MWKTGQASGNKMARWLLPPVYSSGPEMPIEEKDGVSVVLPEEGTWTDLEPAYETVMLDEKDAFLWIETIWTKVSLTRLSPSLMDLEFRETVEARGWVYLSQELENAMVVGRVLGTAPDQLFRQAEREVVWAACQRAEMEMERMEVRVELGDRKNMRRPLRTMRVRGIGTEWRAVTLGRDHAFMMVEYLRDDLYSGYDQLPLDARDRPYTAMHTPVGQLQMQVTPMGFTNAVAEAQRRMLAVTGDMFPEKCEPYIDDNPVKGARYKDETEVDPGVRKFIWDHLQDIKDLLQRFLLYNITASGPKSILAVPEVTIPGFRCEAYGRRPDPAKTDKISQWPTHLRTTTEVRAFLGVVGFWRIFIKGFAKIAEPIRAMIRESGTMDWTEDMEEAAQTLKDILSSDEVILAAPCFNDEVGRPFILETDGGPMEVGGVLIKKSEQGKERPIRFESWTLIAAERRYSQFKKEVLAILYCLKTFQDYLFGRRFILRIDRTNVAGALKNYKPIDPTVGKWIGFIWQFDYKVERIAGFETGRMG
ncbi:hypothetical protein CBR_g47069 [Chara braunii]|uniref:Reverse transcriptase/retrotransposon-derived protein RNase H-like domain-containing protein n=1 Tax=Chara braunii TaxID=69332 RepID=A0A388M1C2_CHABU|nr:hypothetical protein CBR_g47069 [Chara braunii]|eukprot:GBG88370.1 hypothetical protein CBR_g47069 [Chara braunii]